MRLIATVLLLAGWTAAAGADQQLDLAGTRHLEFEVSHGTWMSLDVSPDGERIVFDLLGDLYFLPIEGGAATRLTSGMAFDSQPRFSPDGRRIVFVSDRDGGENVWSIDLEGEDPVRLGEGGKLVEFASPIYAPDGSHVLTSRTSWPLGTFELWAYHVDGGKGVQITKAKNGGDLPVSQRSNALGALYSADGRYLYYARKNGGFGYNLSLPQWQIARRDLLSGYEDILTQAQGSAFRPALSPDGRLLVYGTRYQQRSGLRVRDLTTGEDSWLVWPVERDEQESRFTRDLLPGYAFTPDGKALIYTSGGGFRRLTLADRTVAEIPFTAQVSQSLGERLYFPYRLGLGPVKARLIMGPSLSPDGRKLAFSAFLELHVMDLDSGEIEVLSPEGQAAFHPAWSPDGRELAYVSWSSAGGQVWRVRANGRSRPRQVSERQGFYTDPVWSPDGERIVALRASSYDRLYREFDFGSPIGSDLVWFPAAGGQATLIIPSRGFGTPHFGPEPDRIYLYLAGEGAGLTSLRYDGTDRRQHLRVTGAGDFMAEEEVAADDVRMAPDGHYALISHANQLYLARLVNPYLQNLEVSLTSPSLPVARLTDIGVDFFGWADSGAEIYWTVGHQLYRRPLASVEFREAQPAAEDEAAGEAEPAQSSDASSTSGTSGTSEKSGRGRTGADRDALAEDHESVSSRPIEVYRPRSAPEGELALVGATVLTMEPGAAPLENATVLIRNDRIVQVAPADEVTVPGAARVIDVAGRFVLPGYVDTHAHYRPLRRVLDPQNWGFLANLAYGVTTGLDVQPSTTDILAYQDLIDAGLMTGPRTLSTGPGIFNNNEFRSEEHAYAVLKRYKDHYGVRNLKAYLAGDRKQRQHIVAAAARLKMMPTTEGGLDMKMELTHVIDGFSGNEHNFPVARLYEDVVQLVARSGIAYTPTLLVTYGGPFGENYFYTHENPHADAKLRRFLPANVIDGRTERRVWFLDAEYTFPQVAESATRIMRAGGRVGVGSHGQLQGLGYHWELEALTSGGMTPLEALTAATRVGAEIIGVAEDLGTVTEGKLADLVVLDKDPRLAIENSRTLRYVIKNGELFDAATLDKLWPEAEPLPDQWWWHGVPSQWHGVPGQWHEVPGQWHEVPDQSR